MTLAIWEINVNLARVKSGAVEKIGEQLTVLGALHVYANSFGRKQL